nr:hypothetical protein [Tanacetum cinerariifolium]
MSDKAKDFLDNLVKEQTMTTPDMWGLVADSFLKKGDVKKALRCMERAFSLPLEKKDWKLDSKTVYKLLKGFGEKAGFNEAHFVKLFVYELRKYVKLDRGMYHTLMKAYINSDKILAFSVTILKTHFEIRSYTTATATISTRNEPKKESLYSRISPLGDPKLAMTPELDNWVQKGLKVRLSEVKQIIHDLRKRRRFHHALEVSEWMNKKGMC